MIGAVREALVVICVTTAAAPVPGADAEPTRKEAFLKRVLAGSRNMPASLVRHIHIFTEPDRVTVGVWAALSYNGGISIRHEVALNRQRATIAAPDL